SISAAALGSRVVMVVRNTSRGDNAKAEICREVPDAEIDVQRCDVSDLADVRSFAELAREEYPRIDAVIHNAGVLPASRAESAQGHELSLATHVLGPVLLTELILPSLRSAPNPQVVFMSSGGMYAQQLPASDLEYRTGAYRGATAYARSKRVQVALTPLLAQKWPGVGVSSMHPGWVDTPGLADALPGFRTAVRPLLRTPAQAADTAVWLIATAPPPQSGQFWHDREPRTPHYLSRTKYTDEQLGRVWTECAEAISVPPGG
ncbi:MAG: SDR family NAD(P)-dependent oxidoreductase, partial [Rhodococcus sp.]|nr:SDR family NAD(P)-dependent oxidoreductase [Rhodococcus sp. (in: high G+C Gram-positive bacteria)]